LICLCDIVNYHLDLTKKTFIRKTAKLKKAQKGIRPGNRRVRPGNRRVRPGKCRIRPGKCGIRPGNAASARENAASARENAASARENAAFSRENALYEHTNTGRGRRSYLCKPYHSWEKGSIENRSGILRRYFPKNTIGEMPHFKKKDRGFERYHSSFLSGFSFFKPLF
jgi:hypothetical protein